MPYGEMSAQAVQHLAGVYVCIRAQRTTEGRAVCEQHINNGVVVLAGVGYARILDTAEKESIV